jgi:serine protease AprX
LIRCPENRSPVKVTGIHMVLLMTLSLTAAAQGTSYRFRVQLTDKNHSNYSLERPDEFLSGRSLDRRARQGISLTEEDLPVSETYLQLLGQFPLRILYTSRWMNSAIIETADSGLFDNLKHLTFVTDVTYLSHSGLNKKSGMRKWEDPAEPEILFSDRQLEMLQGQVLHAMGYMGEGMVIALLDAGFMSADTISGLDSLFLTGRILGTRSFVEPDSGIFWAGNGSHGTHVLSIMGGDLPGQFRGTAPKASYWLIQTEDIRSEYRIEEANWLAGAELADSAGADVINCSLGYSTGFTDPGQNYTYQQMDGKTALVTKAAMLAAARGMLVVTSAGNSGSPLNPWGYITAPADGEKVLAIGAVDASGTRAAFSSRGPSADGRIKPDVMAQGEGTWLIDVDGMVRPGNGTSYSSPVIAGLSACLWQENPDAGADELLDAIRASASLNPWPDNLYGYGIPNFGLAGDIITFDSRTEAPYNRGLVYPNPAGEEIFLDWGQSFSCTMHYTICDLGGRIRQNADIYTSPGIKYRIPVQSLPAGSYLICVTSDSETRTGMFIKLK